jgi:hypothetical protein
MSFLIADVDPIDSTAHPTFTAELLESICQCAQNMPYAIKWSGEPFEKDGVKEYYERMPIDVVLLGTAVEENGHEQYVLKSRTSQFLLENFPGRNKGFRNIVWTLLADLCDQISESIDLLRKLFRHLLFEVGKVIGKAERLTIDENAGNILLVEIEELSRDAKLPKEFIEGRLFNALPDKVGDGVKTDVEFTPQAIVKAIQPSYDMMFFEYQDALAVLC